MKKFSAMMLAVAFAALVTLSGCVSLKPIGMWYTGATYSESATSNVGAAKVGKAVVTAFLGVVALGDGSIQAACKSAGITKIQHVDIELMNILGLYVKATTVVYGE